MPGQVVLLDPWGEPSDVEAAVAGLDVTVAQLDALPEGPGVVALVAGPDFQVGAAEAAALPNLRIVAAPSTGFDHLDLEALGRAGVWATHVAGYCDDEVADHAIAMAIDLLRGITLLDADVRRGGWDFTVSFPRRIGGSVLGIVGLGRIGRAVADRALALGMRVVAFDPYGAPMAGVELLPLHEMMAASDVVTIHALLTDETRGLIDAAALAAMRPESFLVNCARAGLVDSRALGDALTSGRLGGCALDVLPTEPPVDGEPALRWPRTIINPHAAFASPQSVRVPYVRAGEAVAAVLRGAEPDGALVRPQ
jgi:D-3-phosphoglycerate dehydrogenase